MSAAELKVAVEPTGNDLVVARELLCRVAVTTRSQPGQASSFTGDEWRLHGVAVQFVAHMDKQLSLDRETELTAAETARKLLVTQRDFKIVGLNTVSYRAIHFLPPC
jgi:hypothetical protein